MEEKNIMAQEHAALYQEIGRFVVRFESAVEMARRCIYFVIGGRIEQRNFQALMVDVTALPIFKSLRSIIFHQVGKTKPEEFKAIERFLIYSEKMCQVRNSIVHGCWYIEYYSTGEGENEGEGQNEFPRPMKEASFHKHRNTAKGVDYGIGRYSADTIAKYADACKEMEGLFLLLTGVMISEDLSFTVPNIQGKIDKLPDLEFYADGSTSTS